MNATVRGWVAGGWMLTLLALAGAVAVKQLVGDQARRLWGPHAPTGEAPTREWQGPSDDA